MDVWQSAIEINKKREKGSANVSGETSLLFVGSKNSINGEFHGGKTSIIYRFLNRDEQPKPTLALEYTFGRHNRSDFLSKDVCDIWELGGGTLFTHLLEFPLKPRNLLNTTVVVVLDLSIPCDIIETLTAILDAIRAWLDQILSSDEARQLNLNETLMDSARIRFGANHPDAAVVQPFLLPLVVIGGKYDIFQNWEPEQRKIMCRTLRYFSHTNGATLQFFSSKMETLVNRTRMILSNAAFGSPISHTVSQDYTKPLAIPVGADSLKVIGTVEGLKESRGYSNSEMWKEMYKTYFPQISRKSKMPEDPAKDQNFREPNIDDLRLQRDNDLERFMKDLANRGNNLEIREV